MESFADPRQVDFISGSDMPLAGRLGLTGAPGRWRSEMATGRSGRLSADLRDLRSVHGASVLVTLQEAKELAPFGIAGLRTAARRNGLESIWLPIPDGYPPASLDDAMKLVGVIIDRLEAGRVVVVHCLAGIGRTGTIAGCVLVALGATPPEAIARVRAVRSGSIPAPDQRAFVEMFAQVLRANRRPRRSPS